MGMRICTARRSEIDDDIKGQKVRVQATRPRTRCFPAYGADGAYAVRQVYNVAANGRRQRGRETASTSISQKALRSRADPFDDEHEANNNCIGERKNVEQSDNRSSRNGFRPPRMR